MLFFPVCWLSTMLSVQYISPKKILLIGCTNVSITKEKPRTTADMYREDISYLAKYGNYISLDEAVQIARDRNLDIKIKKLENKTATLDKKIAFGNFLPSIGVSMLLDAEMVNLIHK